MVSESENWVARFHDGHRDVLEGCYREHFATVERAVGRSLRGADQETVIQEVFLQIIARPEVRRGFRGGSFAAWIATVAHNRTIDFLRRHRRERPLDAEAVARIPAPEALEERRVAQLLVDAFRREKLPPRWAPVFEARFLQQLSQREAARELGILRTTLAYQELQIRRLLRRFLLEKEGT